MGATPEFLIQWGWGWSGNKKFLCDADVAGLGPRLENHCFKINSFQTGQSGRGGMRQDDGVGSH